MTGMVGSDGKLAYDFKTIVTTSDATAKLKFRQGFITYKDRIFGNPTMKEPVLVLEASTYDLWRCAPDTTNNNLNRFFGFNSFLDFFENSTGIKVIPLNLLDPFLASQMGDLSLAVDGGQVAFFYDKSQWLMLKTRRFTSLSQLSGMNDWNTANGVDFTQVFEGELSEVFNPYASQGATRIPAVKFVFSNTALTSRTIANLSLDVAPTKTTSTKKS